MRNENQRSTAGGEVKGEPTVDGRRESQTRNEVSQSLNSSISQSLNIETEIIREVVRHGNEVIYDNVETDNGETITLNVAQYIDYDLSQDGLQFANPMYNQILAEAVERSGDSNFSAESYFTNHPDIEISRLATQLVIDRHPLGGRFAVEPREGGLCQRVLNLVMTFRLNIVEARLKAIQQELRTVGADHDRMMQLLQEHKETKELCEALAKKLGREIIV